MIACLEDNDEGPKQKYVRYLIVKAWNKKEKISKFYLAVVNKALKPDIDNTSIMLKLLILFHNYFKKGTLHFIFLTFPGPIDSLKYDHKESSPSVILKKIHIHWKSVVESIE